MPNQPIPRSMIEQQLNKLTKRQCQILYWVCHGEDYFQIGERLGYSHNLIQKEMTRVYDLFGMGGREHSREEKRHMLISQICPVHETMVSDPARDCLDRVIEVEETEPDPALLEEVKRDEEEGLIPLKALAPRPQSEPSLPPKQKGRSTMMVPVPPSNARQNPLPWIIVGVLGTLLCVAAVAIIILITREPSTIAQNPPTSGLIGPTQAAQAAPGTASPLLPLPTYTIQPTYTTYPTYTAIPSSTTISQPSATAIPKLAFVPGQVMFTDNFEQGIGSAWKFPSGQWITSNGRLTAQYISFTYDWVWAVIDQPDWTNYLVSADVNVPNIGTIVQQRVAIAVRVTDSQKKYLGFSCSVSCGWSYIGTSNIDYIAGQQSDTLEKGVYEIEAVGNQFVARINGRESQRISLTGFEKGGIALGMTCNYSLGCPSFDSIKVTAK